MFNGGFEHPYTCVAVYPTARKMACNELIKGHSPHFRSGEERGWERHVGGHVWAMGENNKPHIPRAITSWLQRE